MVPDSKQKRLARDLYLGDAAYLQDELAKRGVEAEIVKRANVKGRKKPVYSVYVGSNDHTKAKEIMSQALDGEVSTQQASGGEPAAENHRWGRAQKRLFAALTAGLLGLMTGARVGIKMHNRTLHIMFTVGLSLLMFFLVFCAYGKKES